MQRTNAPTDAAERGAAPWDAAEVARHAGIRGGADAVLVEWCEGVVREDLLLQSAVLAVAERRTVTLYHLFRHPQMRSPEPRWELYTRWDGPFVNTMRLELPVRASEYESFLAETNFPIRAGVAYRAVRTGSNRDWLELAD